MDFQDAKRQGWYYCLLGGVALTVCTLLPAAAQEHRGIISGACVGVGDVVQVSIFESSADGVRTGNFVTLPPEAVGPNGIFSVPFAGEINAAGRSLEEIRGEIETKLANRMVAPSVGVAVIEQNATPVCR